MINRPEYVALSAQLSRLIASYQAQLMAQTVGLDANARVEVARILFKSFHEDYVELFAIGMREAAETALIHYGKELSIPVDDDLADQIVGDHLYGKYYGLTANQRLAILNRSLQRRITIAKGIKSDTAEPLTNALSQQEYGYKRMLLGGIVKVEQDAVVEMAGKVDDPFIRWVLSPRHSRACTCEDLASAIDKQVVKYAEEHDLRINPKGLYFKDNLPNPPHPNCQCGYSIVSGTRVTKNSVRRSVNKIRSILRRIRGK